MLQRRQLTRLNKHVICYYKLGLFRKKKPAFPLYNNTSILKPTYLLINFIVNGETYIGLCAPIWHAFPTLYVT